MARPSTTLVARIVRTRPLHFDLPDRPPVRAASGIRRFGDALVIVQDDAQALARISDDGLVSPVAFGSGAPLDVVPKPKKPDLEACVVLGDGEATRFIAFGSGSTSVRERLVVLERDGHAKVHDGAALYARLRARTDFSGSELNVEAALALGDRVLLFQRGNGAPRGDLRPIDATIELSRDELLAWLDGGAVPELGEAIEHDLGTERGVRFGFTDATSHTLGRETGETRFLYVACAEDSPDTYRDGVVLGARLGIVVGDEVLDTPILDPDGRVTCAKIEGVELVEDRGDLLRLVAVTDPDDATLAASFLEIELRGVEGVLR